jgi:DNA-directed RNA polymerase subunit L
LFKIQIENDGQDVIVVTTKDIKVFDVDDGKEKKEAAQELFPADPITGDYIQLLRLNPRASEQLPGEAIHIEAKATVSTAGVDGAYNVASVASYAMTVDTDRQKLALEKHLKDLRTEYTKQGLSGDALTEELTYAKNGWLALDGKRITKQDSFDFTVESVGVLANEEIVRQACEIMTGRFEELETTLGGTGALVDMISIQPDSFVMVKLANYDYTVAKPLEAVLFKRNWESKDKLDGLDFCATIRPHPHIPEIFLRLHFTKEVMANTQESQSLEEHVRNVVLNAAGLCKAEFAKIHAQLPK